MEVRCCGSTYNRANVEEHRLSMRHLKVGPAASFVLLPFPLCVEGIGVNNLGERHLQKWFYCFAFHNLNWKVDYGDAESG